MGDIKRKRKLFSKPKKLFDRVRIDEENVLIQKYGLKNKKEIWKAKSRVSGYRQRAKKLIGQDIGEQKVFFEKLNKLGFGVKDISEVLALNEENLLVRRLQTILHKKGLANTPKQARQLIVHKHVLVDGRIVNIPSYIVTVDLEDKLELKAMKVKEKVIEEISDGEEEPKEVVEENNEEVKEE